VDNIPLGVDYRRVLTDAVAQSDVMLVVIGRQWLRVADERGHRRLDNPGDPVRIEVEAALARGIPVIPVLVQDAPMPQERELPPSLAPLAYRQGVVVRGDPFFHRDMDSLVSRLDAIFAPAPPPPQPQPAPGAPPAPSQPPSAQQITLSADRFPRRLGQLGFAAYRTARGAEYIAPPLCAVSAGPFLMGSDNRFDPQAEDRELPQHSVTLAAFQIGKFPVTVAEYACFVRAGQKAPQD
jgi:hypothetical protein